MNLNYIKAAEQDIRSLRILKKSLEILNRKRKQLIDSGKPADIKAIDCSKPYTDTHYANDTLNDLLCVCEVNTEIMATEKEIEHIESILAELEKEQYIVLTLFYINNLSALDIAEKIGVESEKTVYNIRNKALMKYCLLSYGAVGKSCQM